MFSVFSDNLSMNLTLRWHIDDHIIKQLSMAAQTPTFRQRAFTFIKLNFSRNRRREVLRFGDHLMFLECPTHAGNLTTPAETTPTTNGININA
jgi:hypothetical protein